MNLIAMVFIQESRGKRRWGMHLEVTVLKLKSNESELAKKMHFSDYFFLIDP